MQEVGTELCLAESTGVGSGGAVGSRSTAVLVGVCWALWLHPGACRLKRAGLYHSGGHGAASCFGRARGEGK